MYIYVVAFNVCLFFLSSLCCFLFSLSLFLFLSSLSPYILFPLTPALSYSLFFPPTLSFSVSPVSSFHLQKQVTITVPKSSAATPKAESYGFGRPVPIKEGNLNKKSQGSLRAEWKKKYLVLTRSEITYYPNIQDYMTMSHGKTFKLQHITTRNPSQRICSISRTTTTTSPNNLSGSEFTDSLTVGSPSLSTTLGDHSDHSNSPSPPPGPLTSSLDVSYNSTASGISSNIRIMGPDSHEYRYIHNEREYRSPISPGGDDFNSSDHFEELGNYVGPRSRYEGALNGGRSHIRNGSLDDNSMLKQLRSGESLNTHK